VSTLDITVVVGRSTHLASNDAHHEIVLAVPSSLNRMINLSKLLGVPERLLVIEVILVANAVIVTASQLSVLIVGVALEVIVVILGVIRLLVSVTVAEFLVLSLVLSTLFNDKSVFN